MPASTQYAMYRQEYQIDLERRGFEQTIFRATDFTIKYCEELLENGIFKRGRHARLHSHRSTAVLQWLLDHDILDVADTMENAAESAATTGGYAIDILHYLIEQAHVPVPKNVFFWIKCDSLDLGVAEYLCNNGADVNGLCMLIRGDDNMPTARQLLPLYLRFWIDFDLNVERSKWAVLESCVCNELPIYLFETCMTVICATHNVIDPESGMSLLHAAVKSYVLGDDDHDECRPVYCRYLLDNHCPVNIKDDDDRTPLHYACRHGMTDVIDMLVEFGAFLDVRDSHGETPLFAAITCCDYDDVHDTVQTLLECGPNVHIPNSSASTPLHAACSRDDDDVMLPIVKMLLEHGASVDMNLVDDDGNTPYRCTHNIDIRRLLKRYGYKTRLRGVV